MAGKNKENKKMETRPAVVVVLGHVDHGKTAILDFIRKTKVAEKESGGITQHIGAYEVEHKGKKITFIDTPGHEAFSAMRSRGAKVADIAVLVIAGEEGVKPQTEEAISHIKEYNIPLVVAINKMDKPAADADKVKRELSNQDILVESWGGKVPSVEVSAKTGKGIEELLEMILLVAEMEDLKTDISGPVQGAVIESYMDEKRGPIATLILQNGVLREGDILGAKSAAAKVKRMEDFQGKAVKEALPSMPVVVLGFEDAPGVGEKIQIYQDIEEAKKNIEKPAKIAFESPSNGDKKILNIILKVDVLGSLEAIEQVLKNLPQEKSVLRILKAEAGDINDSDVKLAAGSRAKIIGFRVKVNPIARKLMEREKLTIINFEVIYELAQAVRNLLEKIIEPELVREDLGKIEILEIFRTEKGGKGNRQIIGGKVIEGRIKKGAFLEIYRSGEKVSQEKGGRGKIIGLQRDKKDIDEVEKGSQCGLLYQGDLKIEEGDILQVYIEEKRKL